LQWNEAPAVIGLEFQSLCVLLRYPSIKVVIPSVRHFDKGRLKRRLGGCEVGRCDFQLHVHVHRVRDCCLQVSWDQRLASQQSDTWPCGRESLCHRPPAGVASSGRVYEPRCVCIRRHISTPCWLRNRSFRFFLWRSHTTRLS
jgi:hypothetical protein